MASTQETIIELKDVDLTKTLPISDLPKINKFNSRMAKKMFWLSLTSLSLLILIILIVIYEPMTVVSKIFLLIAMIYFIIYSFKQLIIDYIIGSRKMSVSYYVYPPLIREYELCQSFFTKCLKSCGDINMDENEEFRKVIKIRDLKTREPIDLSDPDVDKNNRQVVIIETPKV